MNPYNLIKIRLVLLFAKARFKKGHFFQFCASRFLLKLVFVCNIQVSKIPSLNNYSIEDKIEKIKIEKQ